MSKWKPFIDGVLGLEEGKIHLIGGRCSECGSRFFPKRLFCPSCGAESVEEVRISGKGRVYTYTVCHVAPPGIEPPYAIGYVDFNGIRVFGRFEGWKKRNLEIGKEVELIPWVEGKTEDGEEIISYRFEVKNG